jgi:hypothetical protein
MMPEGFGSDQSLVSGQVLLGILHDSQMFRAPSSTDVAEQSADDGTAIT